MSKEVKRIPVRDEQNNVETFIPVGTVEGKADGPTLAVIGGVHATEYAAQDAVVRLWESLNPDGISGKVIVVLAADVLAMCAHHMYTNPIDRKNLNRSFPGKKDGTMAEVIAYTLMEEVVKKADAVVDCHGGEFDEYMAPYIITSIKGDEELDNRTLDLAMALGVPFVEVADASGAWLGGNTLQGAAVLSGRPGMVIEAGGRGERDERSIAITTNSLENALRHLGIKPGKPVPWAGKPVRLDSGFLVKSTQAGIFEPKVAIGDWVEAGELFGIVRDFDGSFLEELRVPEAGTVMTMIASRALTANGFAGKVGVVRSA